MKTTLHIFTIALLSNLFSHAQEAGKKGKLMPNEIQTQSNTRTSNKNVVNERNRGGGNTNYNWNYNYNSGYSEVFLRIPQNGFYTVTIDDQTISNNNGRYRFFDLNSGNHSLTISAGRNLIYRSRFSTFNNTRMVLDFFIYEGLFLLDTVPLAHQGMNNNQYGDIWNNLWNSFYNNQSNNFNWDPYYGQNQNNWNNQNQNNNQNNWNNFDFEQFFNAVKSQSFNNSKIEIIKGQNNNARWRTEEIKRLMQLFSFDKDKLEVAKLCYQNCIDKQNYFNLYGLFSFSSSSTDLNKFINSGGIRN